MDEPNDCEGEHAKLMNSLRAIGVHDEAHFPSNTWLAMKCKHCAGYIHGYVRRGMFSEPRYEFTLGRAIHTDEAF